jgi:hypothetical protein
MQSFQRSMGEWLVAGGDRDAMAGGYGQGRLSLYLPYVLKRGGRHPQLLK